MLLPVAAMTRRDGVVNEIRRAIVLGVLTPGEKLTENGLAKSLQVSRPTMREALGQLTQEGLVVSEPYRGLRIADLDPAAILDIARTRVALDMLAVEDILADASGRRLAAVRAAWREYDALPADAGPVEAHEAHVAFHRRIWEASENALLVRLWPVTEAHLTIVLAYDQAARPNLRRVHDLHESVVEAIESGDLDRVRATLAVHTLDTARDLVEILTSRSVGAS